ncbi:hypothetical protein LQ938_05950 [Microbacterium sp. cx-55]|uniref:hypothetical protein n=1 Tax=unclassified Microbacterium TaxID=2609290 RepID=UPI001CC07B65|nr:MULTISPECIES: hypothetical protein [unclassified Microbacterium]MBZ4486715.1 hypothetical protein [Microbacterium sp. cx-55]MCC4907682.1 hypothetical protein [Microbacterium sp. cx-59]UGB36325.1 hypothetical protein LQ938_05950 [Microbacterium sp. cx-55]
MRDPRRSNGRGLEIFHAVLAVAALVLIAVGLLASMSGSDISVWTFVVGGYLALQSILSWGWHRHRRLASLESNDETAPGA